LTYLLLPPLLLLGYLFNALPYLSLKPISRLAASAHKDVATIKLLGRLVFYPLHWAAVAGLNAFGQLHLHARSTGWPSAPLLSAVVALVFGIVGGLVALRYGELSRESWRALRVRLTQARYRAVLAELRAERAELHDAIEQLARGVELPGELAADGRVGMKQRAL